jgi:peptidyl-prolyl cis-trans isomerase A (cyclophilin A)
MRDRSLVGRLSSPAATRRVGRAVAGVTLIATILAGCDGAAPTSEPGTANRTAATANATVPAPATPLADKVRVRLETDAGPILLELDGRHAPITTANFLAYVDQHRFDGITFYRAARTRGAEGRGFIQGGIRRDYRRMLGPIAHEPTSRTGLRHVDGAISMAKAEGGAGAMGEFFITVGAMPSMDAHGGDEGFAVFGRVVEGMDVVRRILAADTVAHAGRGAMRGQMLETPVRITSARRAE